MVAQRLDFAHKQARKLVRYYDVIYIEDLRVKNMLAKSDTKGYKRSKAGLSAAISDASWSKFLKVLEHQARKAGVEVVKMNAAYTSQRFKYMRVDSQDPFGIVRSGVSSARTVVSR